MAHWTLEGEKAKKGGVIAIGLILITALIVYNITKK
jgi:hypothetical protein